MEIHKKHFWVSPLKLYLGFSAISAPLYHVIQRSRLRQGKECAQRRRERFGITDLVRPEGRLVWFHAASIGESFALFDLIRAVLAEAEDIHVLVTTNSLTSGRLLVERLHHRAVHQFAPYDTRGAVNCYLSHWRPDVAIWAESELWPRLLRETSSRDIPMLLVNARVSLRTLKRWRRWPHVVFDLLKPFHRILVQEHTLAHVLQEVGVPRERLDVVGSLKEDRSPLDASPKKLADMTERLEGRARWLAASTHEGEETALVEAHEKAFGRGGSAPLLVIAPRHPQRGPEIARELQGQGWRVGLRSNGEEPTTDTEIYIADTLGEMGIWYRLCPVAFVGGSLEPVGGHNPYEPVQLGCAVIHGTEVSNFADIYQRLKHCGGAVPANSPDAVAQALLSLQDDVTRQAVTQAARAELQTSASATSATLIAIRERLPTVGARHVSLRPHVNEVSVIAPNFKRRLSGVTSTVVRLVPLQAAQVRIAAAAPALPADVPRVSLWSLLTMSRSGPEGWRVWHARRNIEMVAGLALRILLGKRLKLVFTSASQRHHSRFTRQLIRRMDALVATSEKSASYLEHPAQVIIHGIDTAAFAPCADKPALRSALGMPAGGQLIGCFGRIRAQKGTDLFIEAAIKLCKQHDDLRAVVLGRATRKDYAFLQSLKERVRAEALEDRILFKDEVPVWATADWYRALDLYVAPQRWEGFGLTPLEAMACGVPVVAADVGAFSSLIVQGKTGIIVVPGSHEGITDAVDALLVDPDRRAEFALTARARVEAHFDIRQEAEALVQLYRSLLQ